MGKFTITERNAENPSLYGMEKYSITKEQIEALLQGKKLYSDIGEEYAIEIIMESEEGAKMTNKEKFREDLFGFAFESAAILTELEKVIDEHSQISDSEIISLICTFMDLITGDKLGIDFDILCVRHDMAEKIFKEWPHSAKYYKSRKEVKE